MEKDIYLRYLRYHYSIYGTINNIKDNDTVEFEGQTLKIGWFKRAIRNKYSYYIQGLNKRGCNSKLSIRRYQVLTELNFEWTPQKKLSQDILNNDIYIKYLQKRYETTGTINDISLEEEVEFEGQTLKIGKFLKSIRNQHHYYEEGIDKNQSFSDIALSRYEALDQMNFIWSERKKYFEDFLEFDPYIEYLKEYYEQHGNINGISNRTTITFQGKKLNIGMFLKQIRNFHKTYTTNKTRKYNNRTIALYLKRKSFLDSINFDWTPLATKEEKSKDLFIEYLRRYYQEHGTINDIPFTTEVIYEGQILKIGEFLKSMRYNHKFYVAGKKRAGSNTVFAIARYNALDEMNFIWEKDQTKQYTKIAREKGLRPSTVSHYVKKFNGDIDKALKIATLNKRKKDEKSAQKKNKYNLSNILETFDIDLETLISYLSRTRKHQEKQSISIQMDENTTLWEFCHQNGYNYDVIYRAIRLKMTNKSSEELRTLIEQSISEYKNEGQSTPTTWVYSKYGDEILAKHLLLAINLDPTSILRDMNHHPISLEEAIARDCFRKSSQNKTYIYLESIYEEFTEYYRMVDCSKDFTEETASEALLIKAEELIKEYHLTQEEFCVITSAFQKYTKALYEYRLCDVGFETDEKRRVEKIIEYNFDEDDIKEAIFFPLRFQDKILLGEDNETLKRRNLLKEVTILWGNSKEEEKQEIIRNFNLTREEQMYINKTHQTIDSVTKKTKMYQKD